jgi:hypothetical protein
MVKTSFRIDMETSMIQPVHTDPVESALSILSLRARIMRAQADRGMILAGDDLKDAAEDLEQAYELLKDRIK